MNFYAVKKDWAQSQRGKKAGRQDLGWGLAKARTTMTICWPGSMPQARQGRLCEAGQWTAPLVKARREEGQLKKKTKHFWRGDLLASQKGSAS